MTSRWYVRNIQTGIEVNLNENCTKAGRNPHTRITTKSNVTSKEHAKFYVRDNKLFVEDLKSSNGTYINNVKILPNSLHLLHINDRVGLGTCETEVAEKNIKDYCILEVHQLSSVECIFNDMIRDRHVLEIFDSPEIKQEAISLDDKSLVCKEFLSPYKNSVPENSNILQERDNLYNNNGLYVNNQPSRLDEESLQNFSAKIIPDIISKTSEKPKCSVNVEQTMSPSVSVPYVEDTNGFFNSEQSFPPSFCTNSTFLPVQKANGFVNAGNTKHILDLPVDLESIFLQNDTNMNLERSKKTCNGHLQNIFQTKSFKENIEKSIPATSTSLSIPKNNIQHRAHLRVVPECTHSSPVCVSNISRDGILNNGISELWNPNNLEDKTEDDIQKSKKIKIEVDETITHRKCGYTVEDDCIIIDDDDDGVSSEHFNMKNNENENTLVDSSMFSAIKKELEEMDRVDGELAPVLIESEDESDMDILKCLESSQSPVPPEVPPLDLVTPSTSMGTTRTKKMKKTITVDKQCTKEKTDNTVNGLVVPDKPVLLPNCTNKVNKKYLPPPIIEAPAMNNRRRSSKETNLPAKRKSTETPFHKESRVQKRSADSSNSASLATKKPKLNKEQCENIGEYRKQRLKEIALKNKKEQNKQITPCTVRIKKSDSRGVFLLDNVPLLSTINKPASPQNNSISINKIISTILKWSVSWLKEQEKKPNAPPVVDYDLTKMKLSFTSYKEYQKIVTALLLLEVWYYIFKESSNSHLAFKATVEEEDKTEDAVQLNCISYITEAENKKQVFAKESDLVLVQLCTLLEGKKCLRTLFGYISKSKKTRLYNKTIVDAKYKVEFVVLLKKYKESVTKNVLQFKIVTSLTSSLRLFKSISYLEKSPLCKFILKPTIRDYKIPRVPLSHLISQDLLNPTQLKVVMEATHICLQKEPGMYLIQGPPGTGKTTVITNIVQQLLYGQDENKNVRILLAAPSNAAIDELALRLLKRVKPKLNAEQRKSLKLLRVGARSSVNEEMQDYFLDVLVRKNMKQALCATNSEIAKSVRIIEKKIEELQLKLRSIKGNIQIKNLEGEIVNEKAKINTIIQNSYSHYSVAYKEAEDRLLKHANIICTTLSSCVGKVLNDIFKRAQISFTCCIIDEVTQSSEPETLIPLMLGISNLVLVGDPQQLPATVLSKDAKDLGFEKSLFARINDNFRYQNNNPIVMLNYQYRMHPEICHFANKEYYKGKLNSSAFVAPDWFSRIKPYLVFNVNSNYTNQLYQNDIEIEFVVKILSAIMKHLETAHYSIGIVTPYNTQKVAIIERLKTLCIGKNISINVNTVDSFQGQEKDIMIMSCVRYTPNTFLSNEQRVNVAITRAKYAFYIVGTQSLFENCSVLGKLQEDAKKRNLLKEVGNVNNLDLYKIIAHKTRDL